MQCRSLELSRSSPAEAGYIPGPAAHIYTVESLPTFVRLYALIVVDVPARSGPPATMLGLEVVDEHGSRRAVTGGEVVPELPQNYASPATLYVWREVMFQATLPGTYRLCVRVNEKVVATRPMTVTDRGTEFRRILDEEAFVR